MWTFLISQAKRPALWQVFLLYFLSHQAVFVAVNVQISAAPETQAGLGIPLGVQFYKPHSVRCYEGDK